MEFKISRALESFDAEREVLTHIVMNNSRIDGLEADYADNFSTEELKRLFLLFKDMRSRGLEIDLLTVSKEITGRYGLTGLGKFGGVETITNLGRNLYDVSRWEGCSELLRSLGIRRRLIMNYYMAASEMNEISNDVHEVVCKYFDKISATASSRKDEETCVVGKEMMHVFDEVFSENKKDGTSTYLTDVDAVLGGMYPGQLIILAARPAMGKTALAQNIAEQICGHDGNVLIFSLEMSKAELIKRMWGGQAGVDVSKMRSGTLTDEERTRLQLNTHMYDFKMGIEDRGDITLEQMKLKCKAWKERYGNIDLVVIDYLQLINVQGFKADNTVGKVSHATRELKLLARELECPILLLSQLNRSVETRADKRPMLADLRDSGSVEQDADVVMFLYRDAYYAEQQGRPNYDSWAELHIAKNRSGKTKTVRLAWIPERTKFGNLARG